MNDDRIDAGDVASLLRRIADLESRLEAARAPAGHPPEVEDSLRRLFALMSDGIIIDQDQTIVFANAAAAEVYGADDAADLIGRNVIDLVRSDDREAFAALCRRLLEGARTSPREHRRLRLDGSEFIVEARGSRIQWRGKPAILVVVRDVTDRRRAEEALRASERRYRDLIEGLPLAIQILGRDSRRLYVNRAFLDLVGYATKEQAYARAQPGQFVAPYDRERADRIRLARGRGEAMPSSDEYDLRRPDGVVVPVQVISHPIVWQGRPALQRTYIDLTERKRAAEALSQSEARYRDLVEGSRLGIQIASRDGRRLFVNKALATMMGYDSAEEFFALAPQTMVAPQDRERLRQFRKNRFETGDAETSYEFDSVRKDGSIVPLQAVTRLLVWDGEEAIQRTFIDLTERKRAEEQLRQAQKLEAIGKLTGGVAHDFNNLLAIIVGNAELLEGLVTEGRDLVGNVLRAASRGADLTHRLLAYSRQQPLRMVPTEVNALVADTVDVLRRTLGKPVAIEMALSDDPWRVETDPAELENALLNLAINARDAMPDGGTLVVESANVVVDGADVAPPDECPPGDYVMLAVTDTGSGMSPEVREHAVEPFFTTKDVGEGSGLGLSMVYGFIKQSGGFFEIDSAPGRGSTIRLYLPRATEPAEEASTGETAARRVEPVDGTVLVVEDDADVRKLVVRLLGDLGCAVVEAEDAAAGLAELRRNPAIDLLFTDVVLPRGMSGPDLARAASALRPDLRILFTSGYPAMRDPAPDADGARPPILRKPYTRADLAEAIGAALKGPR